MPGHGAAEAGLLDEDSVIEGSEVRAIDVLGNGQQLRVAVEPEARWHCLAHAEGDVGTSGGAPSPGVGSTILAGCRPSSGARPRSNPESTGRPRRRCAGIWGQQSPATIEINHLGLAPSPRRAGSPILGQETVRIRLTELAARRSVARNGVQWPCASGASCSMRPRRGPSSGVVRQSVDRGRLGMGRLPMGKEQAGRFGPNSGQGCFNDDDA